MNEMLTAPISSLLIIAGLICVVLAIIGRISGKIVIIVPPKRQLALGGVGIVFLVIGLVLGTIIQPPLIDEGIKPTSTPPITSTPTPSPTPTLTQTPTVKITSPKEGDEVPVSTPVSGTFSGELPEGLYMWVVINPHPSPGQWWPQGGRIDPWKGQWNVLAGLGREKEDIGKEFDIAVILVNEKDNQYYTNYLETGQRTGSYPGIPLPPSGKIMDRITVVRI
ncbi:MAG: hypothetical protein KAT65_00790 [Methanophagales archaeon]|nr:hypothetical protein [Methanophagales archaeon]